MMKKLILLLMISVTCSCVAVKQTAHVQRAEELCKTRRYIGDFIDYSKTGPEVFGCGNLIWIRTTVFNSYGKISAHADTCRFKEGDRIYLKRMYSVPDSYGSWDYQVENDSLVVYRVSKYKYENSTLVTTYF